MHNKTLPQTLTLLIVTILGILGKIDIFANMIDRVSSNIFFITKMAYYFSHKIKILKYLLNVTFMYFKPNMSLAMNNNFNSSETKEMTISLTSFFIAILLPTHSFHKRYRYQIQYHITKKNHRPLTDT